MTKAEEVIALIRTDYISAVKACERVGMIESTFRLHVQTQGLDANYARAREERHTHLAEEIIEISDTPFEHEIRKETDDGTYITKQDHIQHRKLQIDARKWYLGKMEPKRFGERLQQDINATGEITHKKVDWSKVPDQVLKDFLDSQKDGE